LLVGVVICPHLKNFLSLARVLGSLPFISFCLIEKENFRDLPTPEHVVEKQPSASVNPRTH
jgi:hypothetical protein